ncbi:MAG: zinc-binding dehydrogenase [Planctomycetales bacterium]|nr:zinc-binding dehydrogenase [Planctomycetales bacterium]
MPAPGKVELIDVPEPMLEPRPPEGEPGQIIFQPEIACLCGSDLPYFNGEHPEFTHRKLGHTLHEMVGTVVATNGSRYRPGDKVLAVPVNQCGFFERYVVSEERAIPVDPRVPWGHAVLAQPLGTVIYAIKKLPQVLDLDVAVVGAGPIGQLFIATLRNLGAREIISIDRLESRLKVSSRMGATATINTQTTDAVDEVKRITGGALVDIVVEAVGHSDQVLNLCQRLCKHAGRMLYFGVPPETIDAIRWRELFVKNITVHTSVNPDFRRDFPLAMRWMAEKRIDLLPLVTHTYPLNQVQTAFETFRDRKDGAQKVLLEFPAARRG